MNRNEFGWQTWQVVVAVLLVGQSMGGLAFGVGRALGFWWGFGTMLAAVAALVVWSLMTADRVLVLGNWRGVWLCPGWYLGPWKRHRIHLMEPGIGVVWLVFGPVWRARLHRDTGAENPCPICGAPMPAKYVMAWRWHAGSAMGDVCRACFYAGFVEPRRMPLAPPVPPPPVANDAMDAKERGVCALCQRPLGDAVVMRWLDGDLREICMECSYNTSPVSYKPRSEAEDSGVATNGTNDTKGKTVPDMPGPAPLPPPAPVRRCGSCEFWLENQSGLCVGRAIFPDAAYSCSPGMRREMRPEDGVRCPVWKAKPRGDGE